MLTTLKSRLYFFSFMIMAPFYFLVYLSFDYSRGIVEQELLRSAQLVSNQAAENQHYLVEYTKEFLSSLSSINHIQQPNSEACRRFVSEITPLFHHYVNVGVPNEKGILTCNGTALSQPVNVSDRPYIAEALSQHRFSNSGVQKDRATDRLTINFAYPVFDGTDSNNVVGAAVAVISLDWWGVLLSNSNLPDNSVSFVLDGQGVAVASYPKNTTYKRPDHFDVIWSDSDGANRVFSQYDVLDADGRIQLTFLTGVAVDEALSKVDDHYTFIALSFSVIVTVIFVLLRLFFFRAISKPLSMLSDLALRLGKNEQILAAKPTGVREMDDLQDCFIDMAERKSQAEEKIRRQAQTDSLTEIPNRDAFNRALSDALMLASDNNQKLSIYLIDLDNFKEINDTRGHQRGDNVLKLMAKRLVNGVPQARFIARVGGDEFMLLLGDTHSSSHHIALLSDDLIRLIKQPFFLSFGEVIMSASVGVALFPEDGKNSRELLGAVDQAMYHAKKSGRHTVRRFNKELKDALLNKLALIKDLRHAICNDEFHLVYQPILNKQGIVTKFEALIRWRHPLKGSIPPDQFIPFAEESGDIVEIGAWVIQEAKRALQQVRAVYGDDIQISVNVSPVQLSNHHGKTRELLSGLLAPSDDETRKNGLVVEITEHTLMSLDDETRKTLLGFREKGIEVALDDFGTGYSSLAYIMNYDIDYLKIDKSFVQKLDDEVSSVSLCEAIISMAHKLDMAVIAEGVETEAQLNLLLEYGCDYLQGFYFSKPITLEQVLVYQQDKDRL